MQGPEFELRTPQKKIIFVKIKITFLFANIFFFGSDLCLIWKDEYPLPTYP